MYGVTRQVLGTGSCLVVSMYCYLGFPSSEAPSVVKFGVVPAAPFWTDSWIVFRTLGYWQGVAYLHCPRRVRSPTHSEPGFPHPEGCLLTRGGLVKHS